MRVSLKWLSDYVELPQDIQELCDLYDLTGTGVEGIEEVGQSFDKVVVGQVAEKVEHPDSDHMFVCKLDVGQANLDAQGNPEPLQIVCGASNFKQGDKVPVAMIGAVLPGDIKIKKSKLRGVTSCGMNCSQRELGFGDDIDGLWILPQDAPVGMPFADYLKISDKVLDLEITPNRPDCLSMVGMARETAAILDKDLFLPVEELREAPAAGHSSDYVSVKIDDVSRSCRYTARVIKNVKVGPSPQWLQERITAAGARPINNVVDITNYILFLFGQPLHAFDLDKLSPKGDKVCLSVRAAHNGETLVTLDDQERSLTQDMTVIDCDGRAVALAGVMGGLDTEVDDSTTNIVLEAAVFDHAHTSRTSRNLGLISESSLRYERMVDSTQVAQCSDFACALIAEICQGEVACGRLDEYPVSQQKRILPLRTKRCNALLGLDLDPELMQGILERLGCEVSGQAPCFEVAIPSFRPDLEREIDLYEEILRVYGMDKVPSSLPSSPARVGLRSDEEQTLDKVHMALRSCGINETMTYSFAEPDELECLRMSAEGLGEPVELINPMNSEQSVLRQSLLPQLLRSVARNQARGVKNIQLYELGATYHASAGKMQPKEKKRLAAVLAGAMNNKAWNKNQVAFDFFDAKGAVESLCHELAIPKLRFKALSAEEAPHLQPGRAAQVLSGGTILGWVGEIHPLACQAFDVAAPVAAFELELSALLKSKRPARDFVDIPQYPAVEMDLAVVVDDNLSCERVIQCMSSAGGKLLERVELFDVYKDDKRVGVGKKSLAFSLSYRAQDRTLTSQEVDKTHERLVKKLCAATGAEVRG